jgi:uncharacterized delta-60 repeat protein
MWQTFLSLCLALSGKTTRQRAPRRRPAFSHHVSRLRLEGLEDRCLLSAGALDPTFGNGAGYVTTWPSSYGGVAETVLVQPDGKILAVGEISAAVPGTKKGNLTIHTVFGVARYNTDGSLDTTFGSGGIAQANFGPHEAYCQAATLQPDGKIVLEGYYYGDIALARFNTNGTLDTTFGSGGQVLTSGGFTSRGVVLTSTGKIVAVADNKTDYVLVRYNANGTLDTTFGTGGKVTTAFTGGTYEENLAQQPDGKLVVVGETGAKWQVVRYNADGTLDPNFGTGGVVTTSFASSSTTFDVAIYPNAGTVNDGKIIVVGGGAVARYNVNGTLDPTFGTGGEVLTTGSNTAVAIAADGKPVVASIQSGFHLARYNVDGTPDSTFGTGGVVTPTVPIDYAIWGLAIESNGDIAVAGCEGFPTPPPNRIFVVARFLASEPQIGAFTASPNPVTAGSSVTLTASNIVDLNPGATITQVTFYYYDSSGTKVTLGTVTQSSGGAWTLTSTNAFGLPAGTYTLYAQAKDSDGVFSDPLALTLQVM